jgi:hypothetical protein
MGYDQHYKASTARPTDKDHNNSTLYLLVLPISTYLTNRSDYVAKYKYIQRAVGRCALGATTGGPRLDRQR